MLTRNVALNLLKTYIKDAYILKHSLATEAIMRKLAEYFQEDVELWGITGLLHDLDLELVNYDLNIHTKKTVEILSSYDFDKNAIHAILAHNEKSGVSCETKFDFALSASETVTGLIIATTLVYPSKKLDDVRFESIKKRMKEKRFAEKINRNRILLCEKAGIQLDQFLKLSLSAMREISKELGL